MCGSRGGDSTDEQPAGSSIDTDAGSVAAVTPWREGPNLATDLPEVEPSYYVEPTPEPTVPPAPVQRVQAVATPVPYTSGAEQWRDLVASIMPAETVDRWLRVIACESGGNPNAVGAQGELGLLQVHPRYHRDATTDPEGNVRAAYRISGGGYDFGPWSCRGW